jgi:hypothetical protein
LASVNNAVGVVINVSAINVSAIIPQLGSQSYLIPIVNGVINDVQASAKLPPEVREKCALLALELAGYSTSLV